MQKNYSSHKKSQFQPPQSTSTRCIDNKSALNSDVMPLFGNLIPQSTSRVNPILSFQEYTGDNETWTLDFVTISFELDDIKIDTMKKKTQPSQGTNCST